MSTWLSPAATEAIARCSSMESRPLWPPLLMAPMTLGVALAVDELHGQDAQHERAQLLGHRVARQQQRNEIVHKVGLRRIELRQGLRRGVAQEQRVQRQQAHRGRVAAALQRGKVPRRADARQQLEPGPMHAPVRSSGLRM